MSVRRLASGFFLAFAILAAAPAPASDLSYSFLEFGSIVAETDVSGTQVVGLQTVSLVPDDGDGLAIGGSLAVGRRFYFGGSYRAAVIATDAIIVSPLTTATVAGSFDWTTSSVAFGAVIPFGDRVDLFVELG